MKIIKDFYKSGEYHKCRFCGVGIQHLTKVTLADGTTIKDVLQPNALFAHGIMPLENGTSFRFNGCIECVSKIKALDYDAICENDPVMVKYKLKPLKSGSYKVQDIAAICKTMLQTR